MKTGRSFILIAEEYIKSGMIDEAILVLKEGLESYPNYTGARVLLARAYMEKGMSNEALDEFERVVEVSPDNLFAHRKLVDLYREMGRVDDAIRSCKILLEFNPKDKEIADIISTLMEEKIKAEKSVETPLPEVAKQKEEPEEVVDFTSSWEISDAEEKISNEFETETMADLFVSQGDVERGIEIYKRILDRDPSNDSVREKLETLTGDPVDKKKVYISRLEEFLKEIQRHRR